MKKKKKKNGKDKTDVDGHRRMLTGFPPRSLTEDPQKKNMSLKTPHAFLLTFFCRNDNFCPPVEGLTSTNYWLLPRRAVFFVIGYGKPQLDGCPLENRPNAEEHEQRWKNGCNVRASVKVSIITVRQRKPVEHENPWWKVKGLWIYSLTLFQSSLLFCNYFPTNSRPAAKLCGSSPETKT